MKNEGIEMVICGNEDPLVEGLGDFLRERFDNLLFVGPGKEGAQLEGSKDFAKEFMARHNIPTAAYFAVNKDNIQEGYRFLESRKAPYVLKADGLAAGKGVLIIDSLEDAKKSLAEMLDGQFGKASQKVVIEEFMTGIECSVFALADAAGNYKIIGLAKDYKRIGEGDKGLNTGGMGAVSPLPFADDNFMQKVERRIVAPTVKGLKSDGIDYRGFIFFGLMRTPAGDPKVVEYNVRMGDPETEVVMPRLKSDLVTLLQLTATNKLSDAEVVISSEAAATVMAVSKGYPGGYAKGLEISGILQPKNAVIYHAGSKKTSDGQLITSGGRVLAATSLAPTLKEALENSYRALEDIKFEGMTYRRDIGQDVMSWE